MAAMEDNVTPSVRLSDRAVGWITCGATVAALGLSYRNQFDFATQHGGYPVWAALVFPVVIDSFVIVGELRLYSAVSRDENWRIKVWAWLLTLGGLAASVAAAIAHVGLTAPAGMKLAAAVPPLAAAASLGTGLGIVKLRSRQQGARPGGAAQPTVPARRRGPARRVQVDAAAMYAQLQQDRADGLATGRKAFAQRHGYTEHQVRTVLAGANGS